MLEKGLTMPNRRLGFGQQRVRNIIKYVNEYIREYDANPVQVQATLNDLAEYLSIHKDALYNLPEDIVSGIENLMKYNNIHFISKKHYYYVELFFHLQTPFLFV